MFTQETTGKQWKTLRNLIGKLIFCMHYNIQGVPTFQGHTAWSDW